MKLNTQSQLLIHIFMGKETKVWAAVPPEARNCRKARSTQKAQTILASSGKER